MTAIIAKVNFIIQTKKTRNIKRCTRCETTSVSKKSIQLFLIISNFPQKKINMLFAGLGRSTLGNTVPLVLSAALGLQPRVVLKTLGTVLHSYHMLMSKILTQYGLSSGKWPSPFKFMGGSPLLLEILNHRQKTCPTEQFTLNSISIFI